LEQKIPGLRFLVIESDAPFVSCGFYFPSSNLATKAKNTIIQGMNLCAFGHVDTKKCLAIKIRLKEWEEVSAKLRKEPRFDMMSLEAKVADLGNACWTYKHFTEDIQTRQVINK
jgi:hypothetical protein